MHLAVADSREGHQCHVEAVEERPSFDEMKTERAEDEQSDHQDEYIQESALSSLHAMWI